MSDEGDFYPFREDLEPANNFRRVGREIISIAEGPVEIIVGKTSVFVFDPNRDLSEKFWNEEFKEIDCIVATARSLRGLLSGTGETPYIRLSNNEDVMLGREHDNLDSILDDDYISRAHMLIDRDAQGRLTLHDLGSTNGTYVRNLRINQGDWSSPVYYSGTEETSPETNLKSRNQQVGSTIASDEHPNRNEDAVFTDEAHDALGVFDGVGSSHEAGLASRLAAEYIEANLTNLPSEVSKAFARIILCELLLDAHQAILEQARGAETTAAVAKFFRDSDGSPYAVIAYAGDSRAYLQRDGKLEALTIDHAFIGDDNKLRRRDLQDTLSDATSLEELSPEQRELFKRRNIITSSLGKQHGTPTISYGMVEFLHPNDIIILTSDGVHDNLTTTEIQDVAANASFIRLTDELVEAAHKRSQGNHFRSKVDDITAAAVVFRG